MRGRKISAADSSCILFMRHKTSCPEYGNNSPTRECDCIEVVQFSDGSRRSTHEWKWSKAEDAAQRMLRNRLGLVDIPPAKPEVYSVEDYTVQRAVDEWIGEREQDGINNVKAVYLTKRLVAWCKRNDRRHLGQIQTRRIGLDEKQDAKMYPASSCSFIFLLRREECFHLWSASPKQSCGEKQAKHSQNEEDSDYEVIAAPIIMRHHYAALAQVMRQRK